ncbi:type II secretion system F family protein [Pseudohongiella sp. SYSU M77423]|uniref:type II secretion system F family protein n=1 Tax=Pseudohongiella sp. SYSU M77423 TaxID=3042312 RepID=UPI002480CE23|nr:type II secretion system F family protein [Pseudohongiella sp. SYSU M77423]MDH7942693.1 type II secretion system F family protein [Pseudohongiella sp. SYSU M77423]
MAYFQYKARNNKGALISGNLEAVNLDAAASELLGLGYTPIDIKAARGRTPDSDRDSVAKKTQARSRTAAGSKPGRVDFNADAFQALNAALKKRKITLDDQIIFARQMQSLTKAGMPLDRALKGLQASNKNPSFQAVLKQIQQSLESGQTLSTALGHHPKIFSTLFISLVDVGENTGRLDMAFEQIVRYLELEKNTRKQVKSATRYPSFVLVTIAVALGVITYFVIPAFADTFARLGAELPFETRLLIGISDFVVNWWPFLLGGGATLILTFKAWARSDKGGLAWDEKKRFLPLAGGVIEKVALARFARTFSMILKAGVPIVHGMGIVASTVGNRFIAKRVIKMREGISRGETLYNTAVNAGMFSPLVLQMIAVGEESGTIDQLMEDVAEFYDAEVQYELKRMGEAIEPVLIMVIAGMVLILALGVFLPIWDLSAAARN